MWIFPALVEFLNQYNIPIQNFIFCSLVFLFMVTDIHKLIGHGIRLLIGIAGVILVIAAVVFVMYLFLAWLVSLL